MKLKIRKKESIEVLLLAIAMLYRINAVRVQWYFRYFFVLPIIVFGVTYYLKSQRSEKAKISTRIFLYSMMPHIVAFLYTLFLLAIGRAEGQYFSRTFSNTAQMMLTGLFVLSMTMLHGEGSVMIVFKAMVVSYVLTLIMALRGIGVSGIVSYIRSPRTSSYSMWFEMHDLCLSISLMLLYFVFGEKGAQRSWGRIVTASIIMFLGFKRIGILAFLIALVYGFWTQKRIAGMHTVKLWISAVAILVVGFLYTYACTTDLYRQIALRYGIDTASRIRIYANFRQYYDLSFAWLGKGLGYVTKHLTVLQQTGSFGVGGIVALHNDLLLQYIELGFWGSIIWFVYYIFNLPKRIRIRYGYGAERIYYILLVCAFITYCSDNTMHYFIFQSTFFLIMTCEIMASRREDSRQISSVERTMSC